MDARNDDGPAAASGDNPVRAYYDQTAEREWQRLTRLDDGAVEQALHARAFAQFLPAPPARVLDLGGGPGRWTLWLAERGYAVTLADLSPGLLTLAREKIAQAPAHVRARVEAVVEADARDLSSLAAGTPFDAVLALGPFYHLTGARDRERAASETHRVLRAGGLLFAAVMPRYARLVAAVLEHGRNAFPGRVERILRSGVYQDERPGRFTGAYLFDPGEVAGFFAANGFDARRLMASQGFLSLLQTEAGDLAGRDPHAYAVLLDLAYATADDPTLFGMAAHLLYVGQRADT